MRMRKLAAQNLTVQFRPPVVALTKSIFALREFLKRTYGRIDVLINNAGQHHPCGEKNRRGAKRESLRTQPMQQCKKRRDMPRLLSPDFWKSQLAAVVNASRLFGPSLLIACFLGRLFKKAPMIAN